MSDRPTREAERFVNRIFKFYVTNMINDDDEVRAKRELLEVIAAETQLAFRRGQRAKVRHG